MRRAGLGPLATRLRRRYSCRMDDPKAALLTVLKSPIVGTMFPLLPAMAGLIESLAGSGKRVEEAKLADDGLAGVLAREESLARIAEATARVQQELAIAGRIATADEVEIEEFYDGTAEGSAGVKADGKGVTAGLSANGRRVTRRVVRFKGWNGATVGSGPTAAEGAPASSGVKGHST